jgi:hypothetical protein
LVARRGCGGMIRTTLWRKPAASHDSD